MSGKATSVLEADVSVDFDRRYTNAAIEGKVLVGDNCIIGEGVCIKESSVIGQSCHIEAKSIIEDSIIWSDSYIGEKCSLKSSIVADHSEIGSGSSLDSVVIGDHVLVPPGFEQFGG